MPERVLHFRSLSQRERQVLLSIRTDEDEVLPGGRISPFVALNRTAKALDLVIGEPASRFVHTDEKRLLSWLSLAQRGKLERNSPVLCALADILFECSGVLKATDCYLDHRNTVWFDAAAASGGPLVRTEPSGTPSTPISARHSGAAVQSLQSRIIQFVIEHGTAATRELNAIGASRQVVSTMRKKGTLRRIRHGLYTIGNISRTSAAQAASA